MFGKLRLLEVGAGNTLPRFNPRVRGTCLVSVESSEATLRTDSCTKRSFNPRVRGTCLVSRL